MYIQCPNCGRNYDDEHCWTICPHGPLWAPLDSYCLKHDLVNCFICKETNMTKEQIDNIFTYHAPKEGQPAKYETLRENARQLAHAINQLCPESREKSLAITNLQLSVMLANASIAINE